MPLDGFSSHSRFHQVRTGVAQALKRECVTSLSLLLLQVVAKATSDDEEELKKLTFDMDACRYADTESKQILV
eukprot:750541-Hanusia_phi.AAC.1